MPNGKHTFKHQSRTYGKEMIFSAFEANAETYVAFGETKTLLNKLVKMGYIIQDGTVFHPDYWTILSRDQRIGLYTHMHQLPNGCIKLGYVQSINSKRR
jgi:hypothetical protein